MPRWTGRTRLAALLAVGTIGIAACGGSSNQKSAYSGSTSTGASSGSSSSSGLTPAQKTAAAQFQAAGQEVKAAGEAVKANRTDPGPWNQLADGAKKGAAALNSTTWPSAVQSQTTALAQSLSGLSTDAAKVATDLGNKDASSAQTDELQFKSDYTGYLAAAQAFAQAAQAAGLAG
jgi:hypothetical protein